MLFFTLIAWSWLSISPLAPIAGEIIGITWGIILLSVFPVVIISCIVLGLKSRRKGIRKKCKYCGGINRSGSKKCMNCGMPFKEGKCKGKVPTCPICKGELKGRRCMSCNAVLCITCNNWNVGGEIHCASCKSTLPSYWILTRYSKSFLFFFIHLLIHSFSLPIPLN